MLAKKKIIAASLLGLAASVAALPAQAAGVAGASAAISNFSYQLIDLDLADGIAPSLTFTELSAFSYSSSSLTGRDSRSDFGSTSISNANGRASTESSAVGVSASTRLANPVDYSDYLVAQVWNSRKFSLSANTLVVFSATASLRSDYVVNSAWNAANAELKGTLDSAWSDPEHHFAEFTNSVELPSRAQGSSDVFLLGSLRSWNYTTLGYIQMNVATDSSMGPGGVSPVPEPSSYAMLFAGLGLLGFAARRRRGAAR